jgi:hypothetical protein
MKAWAIKHPESLMTLCGLIAGLLLVVVPAHAQKSKATLNTEIGVSFPDNNVGAITPQVLRNITGDIVNSIMPAAPVVSGNLACFDGTTGLLKDCTSAPILSIANGHLIANATGSAAAPQDTAPSTWFDAAYCNTAGFVIARLTGAWTCSNTQPVNARWLGATGNGVTNDNTALQLCITTALGLHGSCYIPAGQYVYTSASLTAGSHVNIYGDGVQSSGQQCYVPLGCSNLNAAAMANATTLLPASTISAFNIASDDAVQIHDLQVGYTTQPTALSGIACFIISPTVSTHVNSQTSIWNTMCSGADRGIYSLNCVHCSFHHNHFYNEVSFSIIMDGTPATTNVGDWEISSSTFISGSATTFSHINIIAGGCGRIANNKLDTGGSINVTTGILLNPKANASLEPCQIVGNTIEGNNKGIWYTNPGAGATATQGIISGNQIWSAVGVTGGVCLQIDSGSQWVSGLAAGVNFCNVGGTGGVGIVVGNSSASNLNFEGWTFGATTSGATAWTIGTGLLNIKIDGETNLTSSTNVGMTDTVVHRTYSLGLYSVTAFTTIATLTPSTTSTFAAGLVRCDLGGNTATTGNGQRTSIWHFEVPNGVPTVAVLGADVTNGAPPGFRLNISGNNIQVQAQSSDGTHALSVGYMTCVFEIPNGTNPLTWLVSN